MGRVIYLPQANQPQPAERRCQYTWLYLGREWPPVRRCTDPAVEIVHVDDEDKDLCHKHAIGARDYNNQMEV